MQTAMATPPPAAPYAAPPAAVPLPSGFGDYEVIEEIGRGGMGLVYKARQKSLNRLVALKMMLGGQFATAQARARFKVEAESTAQLQHPHIVVIHEVGEHEGLPYLVMDYVEGRGLDELAREKPLPARSAAGYVAAIADAIAYAHDKGILHRDLKPSNVLIDDKEEVRITDFGLAKRLSSQSEIVNRKSEISLTLSGQALGSPNYMPPEQAAGQHQRIGPASDVYGMGATLYFLVTGRPPFVGDTITATTRQVMENDPVAPRLLNPRVPRDLETVILKCLEKDPVKRYASAQELLDELRRFLGDEPIRARPPSWMEKSWRWCRRKPALAGALAVVAVLTVVSTFTAVRLKITSVGQQREFYYASLAQVQGLIRQGNIDRARETLLKCPESLRHWEWGYLMAQCHQAVVTIPARTNTALVLQQV
jgi:serine/threonine protein kinase